MPATVIPFKPRAVDAVAAAVPVNGIAQILGFPSRPHSLTAGDIAALEALAPTLNGVWTCEILVNDDGDNWAVFEALHALPLMFLVCRSGYRLELFDMEGQPVVTYINVDALTMMLADAIGQRLVASV
jgi:hypothetical protein